MNHAWTSHGHTCCDQPGPPAGDRPQLVARCGGPAICTKCATEAAAIHAPDGETRFRIATELRQSATIMEPHKAAVYREIADFIERTPTP